MPQSQLDRWWVADGAARTIKLKDRSHDDTPCIAIPIFMPTSGRAWCRKCQGHDVPGGCFCAKLDIRSNAMCFSGAVTSTAASVKCGDRPDFVQILVVKSAELDAYRKHCPDDAAIFVLPIHSEQDYPNGAGVGHARHFTKKLAEAICPSAFPFAFMVDDSVQYWVGVTLANDPIPQFGLDPEALAQRRTDISLADVLLHFQLKPDVMAELGVIGFYRANGFCNSNRAYDRTHCTKAVILNLDKLKGVEFERGAHLWEDLLFHWEAQHLDWQAPNSKLIANDAPASISCKCYRFQCSSPQLTGGGCSYVVARRDAAEETDADREADPSLPDPVPAPVPAPAPAPAPAPPSAPLPPLPDKPKIDYSAEEVAVWMHRTFAQNRPFMEHIEQYKEDVVTNYVDGDTMCSATDKTFADKAIFSFSALHCTQLLAKWTRHSNSNV